MTGPRFADGAVEALRRECQLVSAALLELPEETFQVPTRCPAWDLKQLLGHMYRDVDRTNVGLAQRAPEAADTTAVTYWRSYDPATDAPATAERARQIAAAFSTGRELLEEWDRMWHRACAAAESEDPLRLVKTWGPVLTLEDFLLTRVLEITVHGLDTAHALGRHAWATPEGLSITVGILRELLEAEPPESLGWDEVAFVEAGTGRRPLGDTERRALGPLAKRFPLLA